MRDWRWERAKAAAVFILFILITFGTGLEVNAASGPIRVGDKAPQFEIQGFNSQDLIGKKNVLLVFYRGHF